jgi:cytoplasmic iron level regulating protein YaaA (DUF328/UPF0246 family)
MDLILIACCDRKAPGGKPDPEPKYLDGLLSQADLARLMQARRELAVMTGNAPGPDLGSPNAKRAELLPAYQRYTGVLYHAAKVNERYSRARKSSRLLILSALYGLIDADDPIRKYNLMMKSSLPSRQRVLSFWKTHGLAQMVQECILAIQPERVHDLLSLDYRQALESWPPRLALKGIQYIPYDFPGMGMGALHQRGKILGDLLLKGSI